MHHKAVIIVAVARHLAVWTTYAICNLRLIEEARALQQSTRSCGSLDLVQLMLTWWRIMKGSDRLESVLFIDRIFIAVIVLGRVQSARLTLLNATKALRASQDGRVRASG